MIYAEHLKKLGCDHYSTQEEIKSAYRQKARECHPDLNPGIPATVFISLDESYTFLMKNWKAPKTRPVKDHNDKFYKQWPGLNSNMTVHLPIGDEVLKETSIYCMIRDKEFRVRLPAGLKLPAELVINNIYDRPFTLHVLSSIDTDQYMRDDMRV